MSVRTWLPRRIFGDATLPTGLPLALLLTMLVLALTFAAIHLGASMLTPTLSRRNIAVPQTPGVITQVVTQTTGSLAQTTEVLEQAAVMLALVVIGIGGLGFLLSVALGNRWSSLTLLYLAITLAVALPFFSYATLSGADARAAASSPAINSLYLCPFVPLWQLTDTLDLHPTFGHDSALRGMIGYDSCPLWIGTGLVYLLVGLISYAVALAILRRRRT